MAWGDDVESSDESDDEANDSEPEESFAQQLDEAINGSGSASDIGEVDLVSGLDEVEDEELLRQAWLTFDAEKQSLVKNRIEDLGGETPDVGNSQDETEDTSSDSTETDDTESESSDEAWGGSDSESDSEAAQPSAESLDELEADDTGQEEETEESGNSGRSQQSSGPPAPSNSISPEEAADRDRRWKVMVWGPPKLFKTHFAYTMPEPIAFLDLEGKADDLAKKFTGKNIQIWQPKDMEADPDTKFRRAKKALHEALNWLDWYRENEGKVGTIVVDSMSLMWEWAQFHHKIENYPLKDPEEVDLSANFQSSQESDWSIVKEYHNGEFRELITDSPYHFYWTAMERVSFEKTFDDDDNRQIMEPRGEPNNDYKADTVIRARKDSERGKVGDLVGSNFTDNVFVGLRKPTFPTVKDAIERIENAEAGSSDVSRSQMADDIDAEAIIDFDPQMYVEQ
jgi:hypothetical protein